MKISFPYMGCVTAYKKVLELLGHEVVMPNKPTQKTIELGVKYSPEFICFPFKVMLGTYIEACEKGARFIMSSGGSGPCRAGLYGDLHKEILNDLGYDVEFIVFDSIFEDFKNFYKNLCIIKNKKTIYKLIKSILFIFSLAEKMDTIEKKIKIYRTYELNKGEFNKVWDNVVVMFDKCNTFSELNACNKLVTEMFDKIPLKPMPKKRMRVGIVGEIYVVMESSVNMNIEQTLNDLGVEVENVQYISDWLKHNLNGIIGKSRSKEVIEKAKRFVTINCGGHDMENIGWMVDFSERNFGGAIHLMPFGCLPELVSQSIIPTISKELDMPILSLSIDEQMGTANNQTRIEAFVDLMKNKSYAADSDVNYYKYDHEPLKVNGVVVESGGLSK